MKNWTILAILLTASCVNADDDAGVNSVDVYYYGFEIERITGIHEEEIQELGCRYSSSEEQIGAALAQLDGADTGYDPLDVRARIEMAGKTYFVDRDGIVREGDRYFELDKDSFVRALTLIGDCN